jgi:protein-arginine kinase activator protein McsA
MIKITEKNIFRIIEGLDWRGHVELPSFDLQWLASQLYVNLSSKETEVCDSCNKPAPIVLQTKLGNICAECVEDFNDNIDQIRDAMSDTEEGSNNGRNAAGTPNRAPVGFLGRQLKA